MNALAKTIVALASIGPSLGLVGQQRTDTPVGVPGDTDAAIAASGTAIYVASLHKRNNAGVPADIHAYRSLDGGATWFGLGQLNTVRPNSTVMRVRVAVTGSTVFVAWSENNAGVPEVYVNASRDRGQTWLAQPKLVGTGGAFIELAAANGSGFVVWTSVAAPFAGVLGNVYFQRTTDGGQTWLPAPVRLDSDVGEVRSPQIAANSSGVHVAWYELRNPGGLVVRFNRSTDQGQTWLSPDRQLGTGSDPRIALDGSNVYVVWIDAYNALFDASTDGGSTWRASPIQINDGSPDCFQARIAAAGGAVHVAWIALSSHIAADRSLDGGNSWGIDRQIGGDKASYLELAASGSAVYVSYQRSLPSSLDWRIFSNHSPDAGATWLSEVQVNTLRPLHTPAGPRLALADAKAVVIWTLAYLFGVVPDPPQELRSNVPFVYAPYGPGTAGAGSIVPQLTGSGSPLPGQAVRIETTDGVGGAPGVLLLGLTPASKISFPLLGGTVLVSPMFSVAQMLGGSNGQAGAGSASFLLNIPLQSSVLGVNVNFQGLYLDGQAPAGVSMTPGLQTWIG